MAEFATAPQMELIARLTQEQGLDASTLPRFMSKKRASEAIDFLIESGRRTRARAHELDNAVNPGAWKDRPATPDAALTPGMYKLDGVVYQVRPNQQKTRLYAKRLIEINADRLTEEGELVQIEFEYERGAVFNLREEHRMPLEEGKALCIRYGRCICCNRVLKAAKSVERGIGPKCITYFAA